MCVCKTEKQRERESDCVCGMVRERENKLAALRERKPETTAFGVEKKKKKNLSQR